MYPVVNKRYLYVHQIILISVAGRVVGCANMFHFFSLGAGRAVVLPPPIILQPQKLQTTVSQRVLVVAMRRTCVREPEASSLKNRTQGNGACRPQLASLGLLVDVPGRP